MKKILSAALIALMLFQTAALAQDTAAQDEIVNEYADLINKHLTEYIDMDRVFKYDYFVEKEEEVYVEVLKYHNAVQAVTALGLMDYRDDGTFAEDEYVPLKEFASIILKLNTGYASTELEEKYKLYPDTQFATQHEAAYYLVGVTGYDIFDKKYQGENPRSHTANLEGFLKGISFNGEKNITRGELAKMIFNALQVDIVSQTTYGKDGEYQKLKGQNLLKQLFDTELIYGVVTAQNGMNIYNDGENQKGTIFIDRVKYFIETDVNEELLGKRVQALVKIDDRMDIVGLTVDERDTSFTIKTDDSVYMRDGKLCYSINGDEKSVGLSGLKHIVVNDREISLSELKNNLENYNGEIIFSSSSGANKDYDICIVKEYQTFIVNRVSTNYERIYLEHGALFNETDEFIDYSNADQISITKNGIPAEITDIMKGNVIDVIETNEGNLIIKVSDALIEGEIEEIDGRRITIDGVSFLLSNVYEKMQETDSNLPDISLKLKGAFLLNSFGNVAGFSYTAQKFTYSVITKFGMLEENSFEGKYVLRILMDGNRFENLELADYVTYDGVEDVSAKEVVESIGENSEDILYLPMRYKLNSRGKIIFLDTMVMNNVEKSDPDAMRHEWTGKTQINYTSMNGQAGTVTDTNCLISPQLTYIEIPEDKSKEEDYLLTHRHPFVNLQEVEGLSLYCLDEFRSARVMTLSSQLPAAPDSGSTTYIYAGLMYATDDENGDYLIAKLYSPWFDDGGFAKVKVIDRKLQEALVKINPGSLVAAQISAGSMKALGLVLDAKELDNDLAAKTQSLTFRSIGTVEKVDVERGVIIMDVDGVKVPLLHQTARLSISYNRKTNEGEVIEIGDINVGDRLLALGMLNHVTFCVLK